MPDRPTQHPASNSEARKSAATMSACHCPVCGNSCVTNHGAAIEAARADAAYFAMWQFFLRLPHSPFSDMVQREAMRLNDLRAALGDPR